MHTIGITASPNQMSKLRNGHAVRIKQGEGCNLIVDPETYNIVSRAFAKGTGIQIRLSPDEIHANKTHAHKMGGTGIFGKKFDKALHKAGIRKVAYEIGDVAKPHIKRAMHQAIDEGAQALEEYAPEASPFIPILTREAKKHGERALDGSGIFGKKFDKALHKAGIKKLAYQVGDVAKPYVKQALNEAIDSGAEALATYAPELAPLTPILTHEAKKHTGRFLDEPDKYTGQGFSGIKLRRPIHNMHEAGVDFADANDLHSRLSADSIKARFGQKPNIGMGGSGLRAPNMVGRGMHSGYGGGYVPQAIVPQPYGANFHMQFMLPPAFQKYNDGTTEPGTAGSGLYAGKGLYA